MRAARLALAFAGFILIGISAGITGALIPSQLADYRVDKVTLGLMFFTFSAGYLLSGLGNGSLIRALGERGQLTLGSAIFVATAAGIGLRPSFGLLLAATVVLGFGTGILDAGLNSYVTTLDGHTGLLNMLHAFFGVGALIGPLLATTLLRYHWPWQHVYLLLSALAIPLLIGFVTLFPRRTPAQVGAATQPSGAPLSRALRRPEVWLGGAFLCLYVGVEVTVGNWSFSLLTEQRGASDLLAGYVVSGYWLGLTLGRFLLNAIATRARISLTTMLYSCLGGLLVATLLTWWGPRLAMMIGFALIGFFLGPVFPTTIAVLPRLTPAWLVPTAVGLLIGASVVGGAVFPWLAGALAQQLGVGSLLPYCLILAVLLVVSWWSLARRMRAPAPLLPRPAGGELGDGGGHLDGISASADSQSHEVGR